MGSRIFHTEEKSPEGNRSFLIIVKRIFVMPVVPSLLDGKERNIWILRGVGHDVVRMISMQVSGAIHKEGTV
jgi:hypothetical protein